MYNRIISYIKKNVLPKLESLPTDVQSVKDAFNAWKVDWTQARAVRLDNLDAKVSTRASVQDVTNVSGKVDGVGTKVDGMGTTITTLDAKVDKVGADAAKAASNDPFVFKTDVIKVPESIFYDPQNRTARQTFNKVVAPNCETVGGSAFSGMGLLREIQMPKLKTVGSSAFEKTGLVEVNLPLCETCDAYAFRNCELVEHLYMPKLKFVNQETFSTLGKSSKKPCKVELPGVIEVGLWGFIHSAINELYLDNCTKYRNSSSLGVGKTVEGSVSLRRAKKVYMPKIRRLLSDTFIDLYCETFDFTDLSVIEAKTFGISAEDFNNPSIGIKNCATNLIIRGSDVCQLNGYSFQKTTDGASPDCPPLNIYVPDNLVDSYKTASNWSRYADRIKPLSQYVEV